MRVLLAFDSGPRVGAGHAVRCLALAEDLVDAGCAVQVTGALDPPAWVAGQLRTLGVATRPAPRGRLLPDDLVDVDVVHVDSYAAVDLLPSVHAAGAVLSSLEDGPYGRRRADLVVDPSLVPDRRPDDGSPLVLVGSAYAPVRRVVRTAAAARTGRPPSARPTALVVLGGTDAAGALSRVVEAVREASRGRDVHIAAVTPHVSSLPEGVTGVEPSPDLPSRFAEVDLVVSAAGTTVAELCTVGVPMALALAADNQAAGLAALVRAGAAVALGDLRHGALDVTALRRLLADATHREALAAAARRLVDGRGARRVRVAMACALASRDGRLRVRPAGPADSDLVLAYRNDPDAVRWSATGPVDPARHRDWFLAGLARDDRVLLVAHDDAGPAATVRWDRLADDADRPAWEVSIAVDPARRGQGLGGSALDAATAALRHAEPRARRLHAAVHDGNDSSRALFASRGWQRTGASDVAGFSRWTR